MTLPYKERAAQATNPVAKRLCKIIEEKKTNLSVAADLTTKDAILNLAKKVGPHIAILKTHIDIVEDFDSSFIKELQSIARDLNFLIFEDRKFADIGNTTILQYTSGLYKIVEWADIVNAHILPGPSIIEGLYRASEGRERGVILLAQMSSKENLFTEDYTKRAVSIAEDFKDFVIGFICQEKISNDPSFIHFTPGVNLSKPNDAIGQVYNTPERILLDKKSDIIIVGRDICKDENPKKQAMKYQEMGWMTYQKRLSLCSIK